MDSIPSQLLLQIILILLNAFFAATEIAVLSLNKTQLEKKAEDGENARKKGRGVSACRTAQSLRRAEGSGLQVQAWLFRLLLRRRVLQTLC